MSTPNPVPAIPSPLPGGEPVTGKNVLLMLASDFVQNFAAPVQGALSTIVAAKGDPVKADAAVISAAGQLVGAGVLTLEDAVTQLAQLAGYGISKLETELPATSS